MVRAVWVRGAGCLRNGFRKYVLDLMPGVARSRLLRDMAMLGLSAKSGGGIKELEFEFCWCYPFGIVGFFVVSHIDFPKWCYLNEA